MPGPPTRMSSPPEPDDDVGAAEAADHVSAARPDEAVRPVRPDDRAVEQAPSLVARARGGAERRVSRRWSCRRRSPRRRGTCTGRPGRSPASRSETRLGARRRREHDGARARPSAPPRPSSTQTRVSSPLVWTSARIVRPRQRDARTRVARADDGCARRAEHDVGAPRRPRRAPGDEARVVLGARREPGDRLGDGDGAAPRARPRARRSRPVRGGRAELEPPVVARPTGSTLPVSTTDVPGELRRRSSRAGLRSSRSCASARRSCRRRSGRRRGSGSACPAAVPPSVAAVDARAREPAPALGVRLPSAALVPYSNHATVPRPRGSTIPLTRAEET